MVRPGLPFFIKILRLLMMLLFSMVTRTTTTEGKDYDYENHFKQLLYIDLY
jgi:hypothetical protein